MTTNGDHPEMERDLPPVMPQPTPTAFSFDLFAQGQKRFVILTVHTPSGQAVYFMEPEIAFGVAKNMRSAAQAVMQMGIVVPD